MSFRIRLILCFALIVVVPAAVVTLGLTRIAGEWSAARDDAGLTAGAETALEVFADQVAAAGAKARKAGRDEALAASLRSRDPGAAQEAVDRLARRLDLAALSVRAPSGQTLASVGAPGASGAVEVAVRGAGDSLGDVRAATLRPDRYVTRVSSLTGSDVALLRGDRVLASTVDVPAGDLPEGEGASDIDLPAGESRAMTAIPNGAGAIRVAVLEPRGSAGFATSPPLLIAGGLALLVLAVLFVVFLVRALQGQVREMLTAARRIGGGDFSRKVPVTGDDELAGLAREFNTMSERLEDQMGELRRQRAELEHSVRRTGEALAAGPDRRALLEVAADVALSACGARSARVMLTGPVRMDAERGDATGELGEAIREAEEQALRRGVSAEAVRGSAFAAAEPLSGARRARGRRRR